MNIADNVIREKIKNVYFIWGRGKTIIANQLEWLYRWREQCESEVGL